MNREIKFRGKRKCGPEWLVGDLNNIDNTIFIFPYRDDAPLNSPDWFEVDTETVGQFTNYSDSGGAHIYEKQRITYAGKAYAVKMIDGCWKAVLQGGAYQFYLSEIAQYSKVNEEDFKTVKPAELC